MDSRMLTGLCNVILKDEIALSSDLNILRRELAAAYMAPPGNWDIPQRAVIWRENPFSAFVSMPAYSERDQLFICKIGAIVPQLAEAGVTSGSIIVAISALDGSLLAILDGTAVTNLKCAAVAALVTEHCAPRDSRVLGLVGAGVQALQQVRAALSVREIERIQVYSRTAARAAGFVEQARQIAPSAEFVVCDSPMQAIANADVLVTATTSTLPLIESLDAVRPDVHINCMGAHTPQSREIASSILRDSCVIVEDKMTALSEAGPDHEHAISIGELMAAKSPLSQQRTIFASTGHALLDLVASRHVMNNRQARSNANR
jgi:ornithine cyclodeaminase/alanine dehydrogenase-like protein (mu-crystallin family)